ncbi:MAG: hypothetical protein RLZZ347_557 [Candidatus Parcubacteria bacterium]|jgi:hypothetical protein
MARDQKKPVKKTVKKTSSKVVQTDNDEVKKKPVVEGDEDEMLGGKERPIQLPDDFEEPIEGGDDFGGALEDDEEEDDTVYGSSDDEDHHYE